VSCAAGDLRPRTERRPSGVFVSDRHDPSGISAQPWPWGRPPTITAATLLAASTLTVMAPTIVAPALPSIAREFASAPRADVLVPLVLTLPALAIALTAPLAGTVVDRIGRRPVLVVGILLYGLAGGSGAIASSLGWLLAGRIGLGLSIAAVLTTITTLIADLYRGEARSRMLSRQAAVIGAAGTVFTVVSGLLVSSGWRWSFLLYLAAWPLLPVVLRYVPEPEVAARTPRRADEPRPVPGPGTVSDPTRFPEEARRATVGSVPRYAAGVLLVSISLMLVVQIVFYLLPVEMPFLLEEEFAASSAQVGLLVAIPPLAYAVSSLTTVRLTAARRRATVVSMAFGVTGVGYLIIGLAGSLPAFVPGLVIGGAGLGLAVPNLVGWVAQAAPEQLRGRLMGALTSVLFLGQFLSPLVWRPIVSVFGRQGSILVAAGLLVVLGGLALAIDTRRR
jgi:MFS family permease